MGNVSPTASIAVKWFLVTILWSAVAVRFWAIRKLKYSIWSPRGLASICILTLPILGTFYCVAATYVVVRIVQFQRLNSEKEVPKKLIKDVLIVSLPGMRLLLLLLAPKLTYYWPLWSYNGCCRFHLLQLSLTW